MLALVCITAKRLYSVHRPIQARSSSVKLITGDHFVVWVVSVLALLPFIPSPSSYMVTKALMSKSAYFHSDTTEYSGISAFANRLSGLINGTKLLTVGLQDVNECLELNFAAIKPNITSYFGYYSVSGVCLPKFYRTADDMSHFNMMSAEIICFKFFALIFIAASYASTYIKSTYSLSTEEVSDRLRNMQKNCYFEFDRCCLLVAHLHNVLSQYGIHCHPVHTLRCFSHNSLVHQQLSESRNIR